MLKNDRWIKEQAALGMLEPFQPELVRHLDPDNAAAPVLSFGCSSYGYDLRLSAREFMIFRHVPGTVMNPKRFNPANLETAPLHEDADGAYFILPAHSYGLGVALEHMRVPPNITVICLGKSTYARLGIIVNTTPAEATDDWVQSRTPPCATDVLFNWNTRFVLMSFTASTPCIWALPKLACRPVYLRTVVSAP